MSEQRVTRLGGAAPSLDDAEIRLLNQVRRWHRYRRPGGIVLFLLGSVLAIGSVYWINNLRVRAEELLNDVNPTTQPTSRQTEEILGQTHFNFGFALGFALAEGLGAGAWAVVSGFFMVLGKRDKDRLLLKLWDEHSGAT